MNIEGSNKLFLMFFLNKSKKGKLYTECVIDFCTFLFKSIEIIS